MANGSIESGQHRYSEAALYESRAARLETPDMMGQLDDFYKALDAMRKNFSKKMSEDIKSQVNLESKLKDTLAKKEAAEQEQREKDLALLAYKEIAKYNKLNNKEKLEYQKLQHEADRKHDKERLKNWADGLSSAINSTITNAGSQAIESAINVYSQYTSAINTRLQGTDRTFKSMNNLLRRNLAISPYVKQTAVLENLSKMVEMGISYNVEQRAFLATISDKIATTFDAFDASLLQIIRIQQADTTVARLGLESSLTKYLNSRYSDTSYLSDGFGSVQKNLMGASALMGDVGSSVEFEYVVQKWLGSLSSVGLSQSAISNISQGIGYLGTGDISALSSNQALMNLLAISASRAGLDLGGILTSGIKTSETNRLLSSLVQYMSEIASSGNKVVLSQLGNVFGLSTTDLAALRNINVSDIKNISSNMLTYSQLIGETESQLASVKSRMYAAEMVDNVLSNVMTGIGESIADNPVTYGIWKANEMVEKLTGGIPLPTIGVAGNFFGANATFNQLIKTGMVGLGAIGEMISAVGSLTSGANGGLNLGVWNASTTLSRGTGYQGITSGISSGVSATQYIGTGDSAMLEQAITSAKGTGEEVSKYSGVRATDSDVIQDMKDILDTSIKSDIAMIKKLMQDVIDGTSSIQVRGSIL